MSLVFLPIFPVAHSLTTSAFSVIGRVREGKADNVARGRNMKKWRIMIQLSAQCRSGRLRNSLPSGLNFSMAIPTTGRRKYRMQNAPKNM